jgi:predicted dienelactone hydrolase
LPGSPSRTLALTIRYPIIALASPSEVPDAEPYGRWPLLVFAHGFDASAATYAPLLRAIAASGFVVVTPEFPLASSTVDAPAVEGDEPEQARDVNFLLDLFTSRKAPAPFDQVISPGSVGVMGHSDGAQTVLLSGYAPAYTDSRIGAVVAVSGRYSAFGGRWFGIGAPPLLVMQASADELNSFAYGVELVQKDLHAAQLVAVDGVTHLGAVTDPAAVVPVANLVADTFAFRLRGNLDAQQRLSDDLGWTPLRLVASHED